MTEIPADAGVSFATETPGCEVRVSFSPHLPPQTQLVANYCLFPPRIAAASSLSLHFPFKGLGNDLRVDKLLSFPVGSGYKPEGRTALKKKTKVKAATMLRGYSDEETKEAVDMEEKD